MNEQEQNEAVAEACEWVEFREEEYPHRMLWRNGPAGSAIFDEPPDYLRDRQAMGDAILALPLSGRYLFCDYVVSLANKRLGQKFKPTRAQWEKAMLSFEVWPEAFLRAIGKWRD